MSTPPADQHPDGGNRARVRPKFLALAQWVRWPDAAERQQGSESLAKRACWPRAVAKWWKERSVTERVSLAGLAVSLVGLAGVAATVIGLIFSIRSFNSSVDSSRVSDLRERYQAISAKEIELDSTLVDHTQALPYFWDQPPKSICEIKDDATHRTVEAIAVQRVDNDAFTYAELVYMGTAPDDGFFRRSGAPIEKGRSKDDWEAWISWSETIIGHFQSSQAMCDEVRANRDSYARSFTDALSESNACDTSAPASPCWTG